MKKFALLLLLLASCSMSHGAFAAKDDVVDTYAYYGFTPDIVTNYISNRKKLGFVKISVELMVQAPEDLVVLQHHDPLLRAAILEILGAQTEDKVKSLVGKEEIRRECYEAVNRLLQQEVGKPLVVNMLFTKYLYD